MAEVSNRTAQFLTCRRIPLPYSRAPMQASDPGTSRSLPSDWLFLALIAALPIMKPDISYPVVVPDLVFLLLVLAVVLELLLRKRHVEWKPGNWILVAYVASLAPSLLASS